MKSPIPFSIFAAALLASSTHAALIGHWSFDEGSGTVAADSSGSGNEGAILGGATWGTDGTRASYLTFDGTDDSVDPSVNLPAMSIGNDFSWSFWANAGGGTVNEVIVGNRYNGVGSTDFGVRQFIKFTPTQFEWHQNANGNDNLDVADLIVGEWHHHAVVKSGDSLEYFFDGISMVSSTLTEDLSASVSLPFFIGGNPGAAAGEHFTGSIDEVRIYDNALSPVEVRTLAGIPEPSVSVLALLGSLVLLRRRR